MAASAIGAMRGLAAPKRSEGEGLPRRSAAKERACRAEAQRRRGLAAPKRSEGGRLVVCG